MCTYNHISYTISKNTPKKKEIENVTKGRGEKSVQLDKNPCSMTWNGELAQNILCRLHGMGHIRFKVLCYFIITCLIRQIVSNYVGNKTVDFTSGSCIILELRCQAYYIMIYWFGKCRRSSSNSMYTKQMHAMHRISHTGINTSLIASHTIWNWFHWLWNKKVIATF